MKRYRRGKKSVGRAILAGVLASVIIFTLLSLISALILMKTNDPSGKIGLAAIISLTLSSVAASAVHAKKYGTGLSIVTAAIVVLILIAASLISTRGEVSAKALGCYGCYMLAAILTSFITGRGR